jgi:hypothetical protein
LCSWARNYCSANTVCHMFDVCKGVQMLDVPITSAAARKHACSVQDLLLCSWARKYCSANTVRHSLDVRKGVQMLDASITSAVERMFLNAKMLFRQYRPPHIGCVQGCTNIWCLKYFYTFRLFFVSWV